jgi:1-acyl-sn-glycerol-3-phosphate acyltransferase
LKYLFKIPSFSKRIIASLIFWIFVDSAVVLTAIIYFILRLAGTLNAGSTNKKLADICARVWSKSVLWALKKICNIDYKIIGQEKLPKTPFIVACKHQSMWETVVFHALFDCPAYVYKKELLKVPAYGWYLKQMSGIKVDRQGGMSALKELITQGKHYIQNGQNIVIFPQGTRVPINKKTSDYPYQSGISALYLACKAPVIPAALNSGVFWSKEKILKKSGHITLEFLDPILPGLNKNEFLHQLETKIENRSDELIELTLKQ